MSKKSQSLWYLTTFLMVLGGWSTRKTPHAEAIPVAILTNPAGTVQIKRSGNGEQFTSLRAKFAFIHPGESVRTGSNGRVAMWQINRAYRDLWLRANQTVARLMPIAQPQGNPSITREDFDNVETRYLSALGDVTRPSPTTAGPDDDMPMSALEPRHSVELSDHPNFGWTAVAGATHYKITLYDGNENPLWEQIVAGITTTLSTRTRPALSPGRYLWQVSALKNGGVMSLNGMEASDTQPFRVETASNTALIRRDLARVSSLRDLTPIPYLTVCSQYNLYPACERALIAALKHTPQDDNLWALLMQVYWKTELWSTREQVRRLRTPFQRAAYVALLPG